MNPAQAVMALFGAALVLALGWALIHDLLLRNRPTRGDAQKDWNPEQEVDRLRGLQRPGGHEGGEFIGGGEGGL